MSHREQSVPAARPYDLLAFGDPVADILLRADALPPPGGKTLGRSLGVWPGGTTANVACAAGRLGLRTAVFGRTGEDAHAQMLRASFGAHGVSSAWLSSMPGEVSASALVVLAPSGEKSIIYMPMAPMNLDSSELPQALAQAQLVYAMPYDIGEFTRLCAHARAAGTRVAIDLETAVVPDWQRMQERAALADVVFFNEAGFIAATGQAPSPAALREVLALGPAEVVVTLGAAGAIVASHDTQARHPAFEATVVDTTGAGDCFNAAYLSARLRAQPIEAALRFACAAASCAVAALGARAGLPDQHQAQAVLANSPKRVSPP